MSSISASGSESPRRPLLVGFLWGGVVATTFIALTVNNAVLSLYGKTFGTAWANAWGAGFTAPITEETAKLIGFVLLLGLAPRLLNSAFDGFVAGAFIGLGFELFEDVLYVFNSAGSDFGANQVSHSVQVTALRMGSGMVSHALYTGLVCAGLMWILGRDPRGRHVAKGLLLIALAVLNHFVWDDAAAIGSALLGGAGPFAVTPIAIVIGVVIALVVGLDAAGSERAWAAAILEPEVASGVLTQAEADAISGTHRHRKQFIKSAHGHGHRRATKHVLAAGQELAVAIGRAGGADAPDVQHARSEVARVRGG